MPLVLLGTGIKLISHITHEARLALIDADIVLFVSPFSLFDEYIQSLNGSSHSLNYLYDEYSSRADVYNAMVLKIVEAAQDGSKNVCVAFYGHPTCFVKPGLEAVNRLEALGVSCSILPGISAEDCLYADLKLNPSVGAAHFEATDLVGRKRVLRSDMLNMIWQPYMFANTGSSLQDNKKPIFDQLIGYLLTFYSEDHRVTIYSAGMLPHEEYRCTTISIKELSHDLLEPVSTLVIPPIVT